jgi:hypothetical protein
MIHRSRQRPTESGSLRKQMDDIWWPIPRSRSTPCSAGSLRLAYARANPSCARSIDQKPKSPRHVAHRTRTWTFHSTPTGASTQFGTYGPGPRRDRVTPSPWMHNCTDTDLRAQPAPGLHVSLYIITAEYPDPPYLPSSTDEREGEPSFLPPPLKKCIKIPLLK